MTLNVLGGQDIGRLGHEMHAAEDDELRVFLLRRLAGKLEAVAREIREIDDRILLIVMAENDQPSIQRRFCRLRCGCAIRFRYLLINIWQRLLPGYTHDTVLCVRPLSPFNLPS